MLIRVGVLCAVRPSWDDVVLGEKLSEEEAWQADVYKAGLLQVSKVFRDDYWNTVHASLNSFNTHSGPILNISSVYLQWYLEMMSELIWL